MSRIHRFFDPETGLEEPLVNGLYAAQTLVARGLMSLCEMPDGRMDEPAFQRLGIAYMHAADNPTYRLDLTQISEYLAQVVAPDRQLSFSDLVTLGAQAIQRDAVRLQHIGRALGITDIASYRFPPPSAEMLPPVADHNYNAPWQAYLPTDQALGRLAETTGRQTHNAATEYRAGQA